MERSSDPDGDLVRGVVRAVDCGGDAIKEYRVRAGATPKPELQALERAQVLPRDRPARDVHRHAAAKVQDACHGLAREEERAESARLGINWIPTGDHGVADADDVILVAVK